MIKTTSSAVLAGVIDNETIPITKTENPKNFPNELNP